MLVLIGMAGLGTEIPYLMYKHRQMQTVADSAAFSAAVALTQGYPAITTEANGVAGALGFVNGANNVTVTINNPPKSGSHTGDSSAVEVIVTQPQTLKLAGLLGVSQYNLSARTVARAGSGSGGYCILSLENDFLTGIGLWGGVTVTLNNCGMAANSSGSEAIEMLSGGTLTAPLVSTVGQLLNVWSTLNVTSLKQNQQPVADPYANVSMPASAGCDYNFFSVGWSATPTTINPGRYCNGLWVANGANVVFSPGVYYIKGGTLGIAASPSVTGTGVTFILTNLDGCLCYANISITNGAVISFSAPTSGPTAGILFFGDHNAPFNTVSMFSGFGTLNMIGAVYLPNHIVTLGGGGTITGCSQLIAWHIDDYFTSLTYDGSCMNGTGMRAIGGSTLLVE